MTAALNILLVNGDAEVRKSLVTLLMTQQSDAVRVVEAANLQAATKLLEADQFDVVFLQLKLPDSEGVNTADKVLSVVKATPVVIMTEASDRNLGVEKLQGVVDLIDRNSSKMHSLLDELKNSVSRWKKMHAGYDEAKTESSEIRKTIDEVKPKLSESVRMNTPK